MHVINLLTKSQTSLVANLIYGTFLTLLNALGYPDYVDHVGGPHGYITKRELTEKNTIERKIFAVTVNV